MFLSIHLISWAHIIFKWRTNGLNSEFSFSSTEIAGQKAQEHSVWQMKEERKMDSRFSRGHNCLFGF